MAFKRSAVRSRLTPPIQSLSFNPHFYLIYPFFKPGFNLKANLFRWFRHCAFGDLIA